MRPSLLLLLLTLLSLQLSAQWQTGLLDRGLDTMHYLVHYPAGYEQDTADWPIILFLHGGGNSGSELQRVREAGLPAEIDGGREMPAIVIAPQNRFLAGFWDHVALTQLLDHFIADNRVDEDRQYITGFSRGGYGAWMTAMHNQGRFAALVPVCGAVPRSYYVWVPKDLPIWVFHGSDDQSIYLEESNGIMEKLWPRMEVKPRFTVYEGTGHNAWDPAYATDELYEWLLSQHR